MYRSPAAVDRASTSLDKPLIKIYKNHLGYETHEVIVVIWKHRRYKLSPDRGLVIYVHRRRVPYSNDERLIRPATIRC